MIYYSLNIFGHGPRAYSGISIYSVFIFLGVIAFFLLINKIFNKQPLKLPENDNLELEQYTLGFEDTYVNVKKRSLSTKVTVYLLTALLIITPLSELLGQLGYNYDYFWIFS
ncbi:hypothetical protein WNY78_02380 [Psychroserpens sp. AS72]|uniref:hypothetical protein n=1 Tax=Psychroserpens sp. AS72 TaxID=3135775 RepID=UPI00316E407B